MAEWLGTTPNWDKPISIKNTIIKRTDNASSSCVLEYNSVIYHHHHPIFNVHFSTHYARFCHQGIRSPYADLTEY